jgi:UDP-N-acetylmuramyl pentapeptide phosphotransferase/UDP-N-acetylglucosamine-1-phosphate transferase
MTFALLVLIAALATFRLTVLVNQDYITETPRKRLQARLPEKLAYMIGCPWCASFWLAIPVSIAVVMWPTNRVVWIVLLALALSAVAGLVSKAHPPEDYGEQLLEARVEAIPQWPPPEQVDSRS